ncbi:MAG: methionyl-tRNA formyltransferase [Clostridium sp.]|uniref:methionyl-tRNA formyltransferase n=1 Tax=Clostridium sp. TaxID=1506 RepID=UPI003D6C8DA9
MALIKVNELKKMDKTRNNVHKVTNGTYTVFLDGGNKYFQLDTYGSENREMTEKISQSFQFDSETARFLVNLLVKEFNIR